MLRGLESGFETLFSDVCSVLAWICRRAGVCVTPVSCSPEPLPGHRREADHHGARGGPTSRFALLLGLVTLEVTPGSGRQIPLTSDSQPGVA